MHQHIADPSAIDYSIRLAEWGAIPIAMSRDALIVGVNLYEDEQLANLKAPATDAEAVAQLLTDYGDFRVKRLPEIIKDNTLQVGRKTKVSLTQLEAALVQLFLPKGQHIPDTALFYFSGHGIRKEQGIAEGFLATSDAYPQLGFYGLSLPWLRRLLRESPVRQQIVWLDCCHSGELLNFAEADPGDRGKGRDRCFIAASREFEAAYEDISGCHSVLTGALLQGLDPKRQENRAVTNYDLIDFLNQALKSVTQRPLFANSGGQILLTGTGAESVNPVLAGICPYKGLTYFDCNEEDPKYFYGRTALTDQLLEKVRQGNFLAVLGASGSGKSSVVRAGLLHQLKLGQRLSGSEDWQLYIFRPGEHPLKRLAEVFVESGLSAIDRATQLAKAEELIGTGDVGLGHLITAVEASRVVLVVDQFEEVFTLCQDRTERQQFFECLLKAGEREDNKLCLVLTMRADFFGKCAEYGELASQIQQHLVTVTPMTPEELEQAITEPAKKVGLEVERELVTEMMADVQGSPGSLPLLQYTLTELWKQRTVERLTLSAYTRLGGVKGTLQKRANEVYESLSPEEQQTAKRIFLELTQLGEGTEDTRRQVKKQDLVSTEQSELLVDRVIQTLADAKLVVTSTLVETGLSSEPVAVVDVAHEALIRHWSRLQEFIDENRDAIRIERKIQAAAEEWRDKKESKDYLLTGLRLGEAEIFLQKETDIVQMSTLAKKLVLRSIKQRRNHRRRLFGTVSTIIASLSGLTIFAFVQLQLSVLREKVAVVDTLLQSTNPVDGLVLAIETTGRSRIPLLEEIRSLILSRLISAVEIARERNAFIGHKQQIIDIALSPNSQYIASASWDGTIRLWDLKGNPIGQPFKGHKAQVLSVAFSPDGQYIVSGGSDAAIQLWDLKGNPSGQQFGGHEDAVMSVTFSPDGQYIASASWDGTIRLWDLKGNSIGNPFKGHVLEVYSVAFSPNGQYIVSGGSDSTIRLWDIKGNPIGEPFRGHEDVVESVAFSPDGQYIVSGSRDKTVRLWDLKGNPIYNPFQGHEDQVQSVAFTLDGRYIVSGSVDATVRLWDLKGNQVGKAFRGHTTGVSSIALSLNGQLIASGSYDGTVRLWDLNSNQTAKLFKVPVTVNSVAFSPDSQHIVSGGSSVLQLWDTQGDLIGEQIYENRVASVAFSPDGKYVIASDGENLQLFSLEGETIGKPFRGHKGFVESVAFSSNGKYIVSGSRDQTVRLWDLKGNPIGEPFRGHEGFVESVAFSPNGKYIVSGSDDQTVRLWDLKGNPIGEPFRGHEEGILSVAFSPNGKFIVSGGADKTIQLWQFDNWKYWLQIGCNRLREHTILKNPKTEITKGTKKTCQKYIWSFKQAPSSTPHLLTEPQSIPETSQAKSTTHENYIGLRYSSNSSLPLGLENEGGNFVGEIDGVDYSISRVSKGNRKMLWLEKLVLRDKYGNPHWEVLDILNIPEIGWQEELVDYSSCQLDGQLNREIIAIVKLEKKEYYTKVKKAWRANLNTGKFQEISPQGITCVNEAWGV